MKIYNTIALSASVSQTFRQIYSRFRPGPLELLCRCEADSAESVSLKSGQLGRYPAVTNRPIAPTYKRNVDHSPAFATKARGRLSDAWTGDRTTKSPSWRHNAAHERASVRDAKTVIKWHQHAFAKAQSGTRRVATLPGLKGGAS
jgi:hypothetical protein